MEGSGARQATDFKPRLKSYFTNPNAYSTFMCENDVLDGKGEGPAVSDWGPGGGVAAAGRGSLDGKALREQAKMRLFERNELKD